ARARVDLLLETGSRIVELAGGAVDPPAPLSPQHETRPQPGTDRDEGEVVDAAGDPSPLLAEGGEVDVVLDRRGASEPLAQVARELRTLETGDVLGERDPASSNGARNPDDETVDQFVAHPGAVAQRRGERCDHLQRRRGSLLGKLDVLPHTDHA